MFSYTEPAAVAAYRACVLHSYHHVDNCSTSLSPSPMTREPSIHRTYKELLHTAKMLQHQICKHAITRKLMVYHRVSALNGISIINETASPLVCSDVKSSSPKWPRGQNFGLGLGQSASKLWPRPRPQTFGLGLASISLSCYVIGHFFCQKSCKIWEFCKFFRQ